MWDAWLAERPENVRKVAEQFPPWKLWRLDILDEGKPTGRFQRVYVECFDEQDDGTITMTVGVDGRFNALAFERSVFGIEPARLTECDLPAEGEITGSAGLSIEQAKQMMRKDQS